MLNTFLRNEKKSSLDKKQTNLVLIEGGRRAIATVETLLIERK